LQPATHYSSLNHSSHTHSHTLNHSLTLSLLHSSSSLIFFTLLHHSSSHSSSSLFYTHSSTHTLLHTLFSLLNPASSVAGRAPPCGGVARPLKEPAMQWRVIHPKHSRRMTVLCPPIADSRSKEQPERVENPAGFRPPQGHSMKTRRVFAPRRGLR
jgi:hypothetical protein